MDTPPPEVKTDISLHARSACAYVPLNEIINHHGAAPRIKHESHNERTERTVE